MIKCAQHGRFNCIDRRCQVDNSGSISINTDGNPAIDIGGGMSIDLSDGSLGIQSGGVTIDLGD